MTRSILIVGNFGIGALEHQYVKHLKKLNWQVHTFDIQTPVQKLKNKNLFSRAAYKIAENTFYSIVNRQLLSFTKTISPLVVLVFKGMEIFPETLSEIKTHTKLLCNYNPDHPFDFHSKGSGNKNVKEAINLYDYYGTYSQKIAQALYKRYQINAFVLPFGYDADICLPKKIGTINKFGFIGAFDHDRLKWLRQLANFPIEVYGEKKWLSKASTFANTSLVIKGEPLFNENYAAYCTESWGIFNFLRPQNLTEQSHNMRTFEVPGFGGLLIANRTEEQSTFFEEDKEAIYFQDIYELKEKLGFLLKHPEKVVKIKQKAYQRVTDAKYSYQHRTSHLMAQFETWLR